MSTPPNPQKRSDPQKRRTVTRAILGVALLALLVGMAANTRFLTPDEATAVSPAEFDAAVYAADNFPAIADAVQTNAHKLTVVVPAVTADPAAAGLEYGNVAGTDKYAIPVTLTGLVSEVDENFLTIAVQGIPPETSVIVPIAQAINGTALRDVTGEIGFSDFTDQTEYQQVANELKAVATTDVVGSIDPAALLDTQVTVDGVFVTNSGPEGTFLVTPVSIESAAE